MKVCTTCDVEYPDSERFCPRDGTPLRPRDASGDLVGSIIADRYHVLRALGEGGMGKVYLAEHVRLKRKSAVKVMHSGLASDADALSRFNREAANACQIQHSNVAAIYDFGDSADGVVYLAMEYVDGESLGRLLAKLGTLPPRRAADIVRQIADGLYVAHRLGIIHRDLKPDNVLIGTTHDGRDGVKIVDFGISKAPRAEGQTVTRTGQVVGTPDYMSPEQLTGEPVDHRSDIYSLGIVAFHMLTGELPFQSNSTQTSMLRRLTERPRRLADVRPDIPWPAKMQSVLDGALELEVVRRYASAAAFSTALSEAAAEMSDTPLDDMQVQVPAAPLAASTSVDLSVPAPSGVSSEELAAIKARLAKSVGPIATVLVKRAAAAAPTRGALIAILAQEIDDARERDRFLKSVG